MTWLFPWEIAFQAPHLIGAPAFDFSSLAVGRPFDVTYPWLFGAGFFPTFVVNNNRIHSPFTHYLPFITLSFTSNVVLFIRTMDPDQPIELTSKQSLTCAEAFDTRSTSSSDLPSDEYCKQLLLNLTPYVLIPATPARQTSEFFDSLNNLDPVKFSPPDSNQTAKNQTMSDK